MPTKMRRTARTSTAVAPVGSPKPERLRAEAAAHAAVGVAHGPVETAPAGGRARGDPERHDGGVEDGCG